MGGVLRFILGDQLTHDLASLQDCDKDADTLWMCEVREEATYVKHHKKKIAFLFSAMRHFAKELEEKGYNIHYTHYEDKDNAGSFTNEVKRAVDKVKPDKIIVTFPGEYRVLQEMKSWEDSFGIPVEIKEDDRFLSQPEEFEDWKKDYKEARMEYFYRMMRKKHDVLMKGKDPEGGQWNYDSENRKPPKEGLNIPKPYMGQNDEITDKVLRLVADKFDDHFGDLEPFYFAVTRDQALYALDKFIEERLPTFGDYQDAMVEGEPWMYHAHIGFYMNCGLLKPLEIIRKAEASYEAGDAPLNAVEGFIRQILGWREYMRGMYWTRMPEFSQENFLEADRKLPEFFWTGQTKMNCLRQCVLDTKKYAYAHHIQRLMVLGNFALLAGIHPDEINEWFLIVYADAYEWVELPNVSGMSQFADGGVIASKPYISSGTYINKMSDYCKNCSYSVSKKNGDKACPFNYLYWDFLSRHKSKLENNQRLGLVYNNLSKMDEEKRRAIHDDAKRFLSSI